VGKSNTIVVSSPTEQTLVHAIGRFGCLFRRVNAPAFVSCQQPLLCECAFVGICTVVWIWAWATYSTPIPCMCKSTVYTLRQRSSTLTKPYRSNCWDYLMAAQVVPVSDHSHYTYHPYLLTWLVPVHQSEEARPSLSGV